MNTAQPTSPLLATSTRFWDKAARKYAAAAIADTAGYEHSLQRVRQHLLPTDRVLELGCGTATTAMRLAPATGHYTATDLSPAMLDIARQKLVDAPADVHRMLHLLVADADVDVPAPAPLAQRRHTATLVTAADAGPHAVEAAKKEAEAAATAAQTEAAANLGWDAVLAFNLLHLVPDLDHTLAHVLRHLRPGGLFISKTPCIALMNPLVPYVALPVLRLLRIVPPIHVLTQDSLVTAIERSGLVIDCVEHHATTQRGRDWRPFVVARKPEV